jgi:hypothetical protein
MRCAFYIYFYFPCTPEELLSESIVTKYWALLDISSNYKTMLYSDTICLVAIFSNLMTMMKHFRWVNFFLGSVIESLKIALSFMCIFVGTLIGMAICCMTLYGSDSLRYSTIPNAVLFLFYD